MSGRAYLCAKAVANGTNLLDAQITQRLDALDDDGVNGLGGVRVVASRSLGHPGPKVKVARPVQAEGVAVEDVGHQDGVALGGKIVGQQLAVLPDANDIGDEEDALALASLVGGGSGQVGVNVAVDLDVLALGLTPRERVSRGLKELTSRSSLH
jgi:hypothetical protein